MSKVCPLFVIFVFTLNIFITPNSGHSIELPIVIIELIEESLKLINNLIGATKEDELLKKMELLQDKMDQVNSKIDNVQTEIQIISDFLLNLPELIKQALRLNDLRKYMTHLNTQYKDYQSYSKNITHFENVTLENFANKVLHGCNSVNDVINQINALMLPAEAGLLDQGILYSMSNSLQKLKYTERCELNLSAHQILYSVYNYIALMEMKGYVMMQFSYMVLKLHNKGNFSMEIENMKNRYKTNTKVTTELLKKATEPLSRDLWKCDPKVHIEGETYIQITRFIQGYIQNEVDLNSGRKCTGGCETLHNPTKRYGCYEELCNHQRTCSGEIHNCRSIMGTYLQVNLAASSSDRRYAFVSFELPGYMECCTVRQMWYTYSSDDYYSSRMVSVSDWSRGFVQCEYCFCLCYEKYGLDYSDRYISLLPVTADIKNNRVITGMRFVKKNQIILIKIQEGKLLPKGNIDLSTVRWVPIDENSLHRFRNGEDYRELTWNYRSLDVTRLSTDQGHVLTGIRFIDQGGHLQIAIAQTPFDYLTGLLITTPPELQWKYSTTVYNKVQLQKPDVPILSPSPSVPNFQNQYVQFTPTDMEKDLAQNTVPYFDAQPVESLLPIPLGGAGIYHKGQSGYGGFIAPVITTYDFNQHL